jgi:hypothetical protein
MKRRLARLRKEIRSAQFWWSDVRYVGPDGLDLLVSPLKGRQEIIWIRTLSTLAILEGWEFIGDPNAATTPPRGRLEVHCG